MTYPVGFDAFVDPDIAMSFRNLSDPFKSRVPIGITNTWTATLYFRATLIGAPPGYSNYEKYLGAIASGASVYKIWEFDRAKPAARITDDLLIELRAYTDAAYTQVFGYADLACKYHLFDHELLTLVDHDDFDDGTKQGWASYGAYGEGLDDTVYLTAPYSLGAWGLTNAAEYRIFIANVVKQPAAARPPKDKWFRICLFLPVNSSPQVKIEDEYLPGQTGMYKSFTIGAVTRAFVVLHLRAGDEAPYANNKINLDEVWVLTE